MHPAPAQDRPARGSGRCVHSGSRAGHARAEEVAMAMRGVRHKSVLPTSRQSRPFPVAWAQPSLHHSDGRDRGGLCAILTPFPSALTQHADCAVTFCSWAPVSPCVRQGAHRCPSLCRGRLPWQDLQDLTWVRTPPGGGSQPLQALTP